MSHVYNVHVWLKTLTLDLKNWSRDTKKSGVYRIAALVYVTLGGVLEERIFTV